MDYPRCFESYEQFDLWIQADSSCYNAGKKIGGHTPICTDCTPTYAASMRAQSRCINTDVVFYKCGSAFRGGEPKKVGVKPAIDMDVKWERADE